MGTPTLGRIKLSYFGNCAVTPESFAQSGTPAFRDSATFGKYRLPERTRILDVSLYSGVLQSASVQLRDSFESCVRHY